MLTKENPMQYMLIYRETTQDLDVRNDPKAAPGYWGAWTAYIGAMANAGVMLNGNGLQPPHTATTVRVRNDKRQVQDGPFADTREHLGGYVIIDVPSLEDALAWAARSPNVTTGSTEVRAVLPPPSGSQKA